MTNITIEKINNEIKEYKDRTKNSADDISDGYHTFGDLYKHRTYLLALAMIHLPYAWKARILEDIGKGVKIRRGGGKHLFADTGAFLRGFAGEPAAEDQH